MGRKQKRPRRKTGGKQPLTLQAAAAYMNAGQFAPAAEVLEKILKADPNHFDAVNALAIACANLGETERAAGLFRRAGEIRPDDPAAPFNMGRALEELGRAGEAADAYRDALRIDPRHAVVLSNLGNLAMAGGETEAAEDYFRRALEIDPALSMAAINLARLCRSENRREEAADLYADILRRTPGDADVRMSLAEVLSGLGRFEETRAQYLALLAQHPEDPAAHYNLGLTLQNLGRLPEALASYGRAVTLRPGYAKAWNNIQYAAKALSFAGGDWETAAGLPPAARAGLDFALARFYLDSFQPQTAADAWERAMAALPECAVEGPGGSPAALPQRTVALLHFGRSGTGLMHSLIDGHPEISSLPGLYLRGYFNAGVWEHLAGGGWRELPDRFIDVFEGLFDSRSPKPVPSRLGDVSEHEGEAEGLTVLGESRDRFIAVDRDLFRSEALDLMRGFERLDPGLFLKIAHVAYERAAGRGGERETIFYHLHNPDAHGILSFLRHVPDARLMMMVRDPVDSCESWLRPDYRGRDYRNMVNRILTMLFDIDRVYFQDRDAVGVRLEDLKARPEETLQAVCDWLGVAMDPCLSEMTMGGMKWWGDPSSPAYSEGEQMAPFGTPASAAPGQAVFSERDRFVLETLFAPFRARFGYCKPEPERLREDLRAVRPMLDGLLDFETALVEAAGVAPDAWKGGADYLLLRAGMMDRWRLLDEAGDYPRMLRPLMAG